MELVDTHCHIQSAGNPAGERSTAEVWAKNPKLTGDGMIATAQAAGVTKLICVGCDLADSRLAISFAQSHERCWASIGLHPHEAKDYADSQSARDEFALLVTEEKVVAIGECGLDYYYEHSPPVDQKEILKFQIELALKHHLPLIFHIREAFDDFWPIFEQYYSSNQPIRGVLHSFTASAVNLQKALKYGLFIGVNGIATFTKSEQQTALYKSIPLDSLLLETDAPFLTPTPYRGTINESKYIRRIAEFMSQLRGDAFDVLATATSRNASKLFGF